MKKFKSTYHREQYVQALAGHINDAMQGNEDLRMEAILDGRTGLNEMNDADLIEFGTDCWDLPVPEVS